MAKITELSSDAKWRLEEYMRCKNDLLYYTEHYAKIPTPGGERLIKLYEPQKPVLEALVKYHHIVSLKSRQVGLSTLLTIYISWCCTFYEGIICGIISRSSAEASDFNRKVMSLIDLLPDWMRPEFDKRTEQTFILKNGCASYSAGVNPANPSSIFRGKSLTILVIDEAAFIPGIVDAAASCMPALFKAQQTARLRNVPYATAIISTPNRTTGMGKFYFDTWSRANRGEGIYHPVVLNWRDIKEFADDPTWYKTQCEILGNVKWKIDQELNCKFISGGNSFFESDTVSALNDVDKDPINTYVINGHELRQWKLPEKDRFYLIGIDTASSYGTDSSTIQIVDYETCEQVAEFQSKLRVDDFCPIVEQVAKIYPNNIIIPECNSYGNQLCEYLSRKGTFNLYQSKQKSKDIRKSSQVKYRYGLYTNPQNRPLIIDALYTYITDDVNVINSKRTALELISLTSNADGKIAAEDGEHDDLSLALAFCYYVRMYDPPQSITMSINNKEVMEDFENLAEWNDEENNIVSARNIFGYGKPSNMDKVDENNHMNKKLKSYINTHLNTLIQSGVNPNNPGSSTIDLFKMLNSDIM